MPNDFSKARIALVVALSVVTVALIGASVWTYGIFRRQWDTPFVRRMATMLHFPAARVGSQWIPYTEYLYHQDAERRFLAGPVAQSEGFDREPTKDMREQILTRLIRTRIVEKTAQDQALPLTPSDVDSAFDALIARAGTTTEPGELETFLENEFGWNEAEFKQNALRPALLETGLKQKKGGDQSAQDAVEKEILDRMEQPDVVRYLKF